MPTSSASDPGAVAIMLERLGVEDGDRVLEIGTGTGYNTALLCARLGDANVTSIDIDPVLVDAARGVLATLGYRPKLVAGDGHDGVADAAPYEAILATCAIGHVPPPWIQQLRTGGRIVAPLTGAHDAALVVLTKTAADEVVGRFDAARLSFMPLRADVDNPLATPHLIGAASLAMPHYGTTTLDPTPLADPADDLSLFLHLHLGPDFAIGATATGVAVSTATSQAEAIREPARSGTWTVVQRGPSRLWDTVEHAVRLWDHLGQPGRERFGITALDRVDRQYVWLDDPDGPYSWPMPL
jgi:protein-L-isoaspartate(D-aspartate) O-methyltransferase